MVNAPSASGAGASGLRSARERALQTVAFEAGGVLLVTPLYAWAAGAGAQESLRLVAALAAIVMTWSALFNTAFDVVEWRCVGRVASARPFGLRLVHAALHEISAVGATWPVIVVLTGLPWAEALLVDLGMTTAYAGYAYLFHLGYDWLRPVARPAAERCQTTPSTTTLRLPIGTPATQIGGACSRIRASTRESTEVACLPRF